MANNNFAKYRRYAQILRNVSYVLTDRVGKFPQGFLYGRNYHDEESETSEIQVGPNWLEEYFDSHTTGPGLWKWRHYFAIYERHLAKFRDQEVHIVEIGIYSGGSLDMWKAYFGEKVHVYGVDIEPACRAYEGSGKRIFIGDQADKNFWRQFIKAVPKLDIVIDDGGHKPFQQIATLEALIPHLRPGGVYICEDLHGRLNPFHDYINGLSRNLHAMGWTDRDDVVVPNNFQRYVNSIHIYPFVTVIEKTTTRVDELSAPKHGTEWQPFLHVPVPE